MARGRRDTPRSEEDRERARLEREQRRARKEGRPIPQSIEELDSALAPQEVLPPQQTPIEPVSQPEVVPETLPEGDPFQPRDPVPPLPWWSRSAAAGVEHDPLATPPRPQSMEDSGATGNWFASPEPHVPTGEEAWANHDEVERAASVFTEDPRIDYSSIQEPQSAPHVEVPGQPALPEPAPPAETPSFEAQPPSSSPQPASAPLPPAAAALPPASSPMPTGAPVPPAPAVFAEREPLLPTPEGDPFFDDENIDSSAEVPAGVAIHNPMAELEPSKPWSRLRRRKQDPDSTAVHVRTAPARRGVSRIAAGLLLTVITAFAIGLILLMQPFKGGGNTPIEVEIPAGSGLGNIAQVLEKNGVISNPGLFKIRAWISGSAGQLRAGRISMKKDMSYGSAIAALKASPMPVQTIKVVIPEGKSIKQLAPLVKAAKVSGDYEAAAVRSPGFNPRTLGRPKGKTGLEGFLFPATYELQRGSATASSLVAQQLQKFSEEFAKVDMKKAKKANLTRYDVLIIASLIDAEVSVPSERRLVASVIYNRLKARMQLGIDATIRYATNNWDRPILKSELLKDDPYNTRKKLGLPPTPIGNPGIESIKAAANPANTKYLYYVVKTNGKPNHVFSTTDAQFQKDVAAYNASRP